MASRNRIALAAAALALLASPAVAWVDDLEAEGRSSFGSVLDDGSDVVDSDPADAPLPPVSSGLPPVSAAPPPVSSSPIGVELDVRTLRRHLVLPAIASLDEISVAGPAVDRAPSGRPVWEMTFALLLVLGSGALVVVGRRAR
jgi:hypothetical protein